MLLATHTGSTHRFSEKQHSSEKALPQKYAASSKRSGQIRTIHNGTAIHVNENILQNSTERTTAPGLADLQHALRAYRKVPMLEHMVCRPQSCRWKQ